MGYEAKIFLFWYIVLVSRWADKICHPFRIALYPGWHNALQAASAGKLTKSVFTELGGFQCQ